MNGWRHTRLICLAGQLTLAWAVSSVAMAQEGSSSQAATRTESLEKQQEEKARKLRPEQASRPEQAFTKYLGENPLRRPLGGITGLRIRFGGLPSGSGFGLGPEYFRPDLAKGQMLFRVAAIGSAKLWYLVDTELQFPYLARRFLGVGIYGRHLDANSVGYYGPGPDSLKGSRSDYRREESTFDVSLAFRPIRRYLSLGFTGGYQWINVGPGMEAAFISTEELFPPSVAPGIDKQANYLRAGPFLEFDSRDRPKDPHRGTHFLAKLNIFSDRKFDQYSFRQVEGSIEQYVPFLNQKRVIALRAKSVLSYPDSGQMIPFYMQPTLGGTSDLRGYRRFRFYDNNMFLMNAEYRWEIFTLMDMALFADAGKVFHRDSDFDLKHLESDLGFGLRFKTRRAVVFRIDTAFSHEGFGLWITFDHVF
ncbi:MAG TPA: BamA/TamA family outer membrane protein [Acidobacteriota bacterium]|nr:BamA/TamA family outer membrane protein [Acidobacteriota bacterium]